MSQPEEKVTPPTPEEVRAAEVEHLRKSGIIKKDAGEIMRSTFEALSPAERSRAARAGIRIVDDPEETREMPEPLRDGEIRRDVFEAQSADVRMDILRSGVRIVD